MSKLFVKETHIQQAYISLCRLVPDEKFRWIHSISNGGYRTEADALQAKAEGLTPGIADISVPFPSDRYHGLYLEFKSANGTLRADQKDFREHCRINGYDYQVVRDVNAALRITLQHAGIDADQLFG